MKVEIVMPKMGESINEGTIIKWYKKVGDTVKKDEIIYEISTDKVDTEIPSPADGILAEIKAYENETVPINEVVAIIETDASTSLPAEKVGSATGASTSSATDASTSPATVAKRESREVAEKKNEEVPSTDQPGSIVDIPMPKMGESVMEGTIIKWHKKVGEEIKADEILYEISTDKVDTEVPSPVTGVLTEILFPENETVDVGVVVAKISTKSGFQKKEETAEIEEEPKPQADLEELKVSESPGKVEKTSKLKVEASNKFFSPVVLNIASKEGVGASELEKVNGTGIGGRVTKKDLLDYISNKGTIQSTPASEISTKFESGDREIIPMDNIRKRIMQHMVNSRDTSVHVTEIMEVDMTKIHNYIEKNRERLLKEDSLKLTYMAFISYAAVKALKEYPLVNSSIDGENIVLKKNINLGIAVAVEPNGLIVPNIKNADEKNIRGLARSISEISSKARNKGLTPDDIMNGTFSITNYGVFGALFGTPIINQPEVAILGVGAVVKKPVVIEVDGADTIGIKPMMYLSLSHDHRLVDGLLGGMFLKSVKDTLENFDVSSI